MEICPHNECTGCYACVSACKHDCIKMEEDELGAIHPYIDDEKCINCGACRKACPNNVSLDFKYPTACYASWITDKEKRRICASGGIGTTMSEYVIRNGGVVFGSRYNENLVPIMTFTERLEELEHFKGSRYVQSLVGNGTFIQVKKFLIDNRQVLFIGTPCQIAGLKSFLKKDYQNLITVDLICHGVCPTKYFTEEVDYLAKKYKLENIEDARFRGNDGNNFRLTLWNKARRKLFPGNNYREKMLRLSESQQFYIWGFLLGVTLRENCYSCKYARPERISDITIGDFIGLGKQVPFDYPKGNVSSVTINTEKGNVFYKSVSDSNDSLINIERNYEERLEYKPSLVEPFHRHPLSSTFIEYYKEEGYVMAIRHTLKDYLLNRQIKLYLNYWTYIYRVPRKVFKIIIGKNGKR